MTSSLVAALDRGPVVLDGGLGTHLGALGHDVSGPLWSAQLLRDDPAALQLAHRDFLRAGAEVVLTASYQVSVEGFGRVGLDPEEALGLLGRSVAVAREAVAESVADGGAPALVAGSLGPYGAVLAGGEEYTGAYVDPGWRGGPPMDVAALRAFHRERMAVLLAAGADVLACETLPALTEVEAVLLAAEDVAAPLWLSLSTVTAADGSVLTRRGEPAGDAFAMARGVPGVVAVGVNCTDPAGTATAVRVAAEASGLPVVAYPNSGEVWDAAGRRWTGEARFDPADVDDWLAAGARLVGGCCRVGPDQVAALARHLHRPAAPSPR